MSEQTFQDTSPIILETKRLILRPWREADDEALFLVASDAEVGPRAGWNPHESVRWSRNLIRTLLMKPGVFAITRKGEGDVPCGSISLALGESRARGRAANEGELGYWIGRPFWNQGYMTEAARVMTGHGFKRFFLSGIWCCYYDGNTASRCVMEKCGFRYHHTDPNDYNPMLKRTFVEHYMYLSREQWERL